MNIGDEILPTGWVEASLGDLVQPLRPRVPPASYPTLRFIGLEHVEAHRMRLLGTQPATSVKSAAVHFEPGDVLYGRLRPYLNKVLRPSFEGLCSAEFIVLPNSPHLDLAFVQYVLNSAEFVSFSNRQNAGDRPRVDFDQLKEYRVSVPPLPEQHRIVAEIEKQFTRLDASLAALERVRANLKRYRAATLAAACEGCLVPAEAELARAGGRNYESAQELLRRNGVAAAPCSVEGWACASVGDLATLVQYGTSAKTSEAAIGVPVIRMGNIFSGRLVLHHLKYLPADHREFPDLLLEPGDLLFNRTNSAELVGKSAVFRASAAPFSFASYLIRVRLSDALLPDLLAYYLNSTFGRAWIKTVVNQQVGQANVNGSKLKSLVLPVAPLAEQTRIVAEVERRLSFVEKLEAVVDDAQKRAAALRQSILKRAFEGKLVPQDPDDEPADVLLEHIRAERAMSATSAASKGSARKKVRA